MPYEALRKECPTTVFTRNQSFLIESIKSLVVILIYVKLPTTNPFNHLIIVGWLLRHRSSDIGWLLGFDLLPFLYTLRHVYIYGCCSILLPTDIANHSFWSFRYIECLFFIDHV